MKLIRIFITGLSLSLLLTSCGAKKKSSSSTPKNRTIAVSDNTNKNNDAIVSEVKDITTTNSKRYSATEEYIESFANTAMNQMRTHKIPASIILAQGILESGSGNSDLTRVSNNHFGIKCHKGWEGARTYYNDDAKGECFRVYEDPASSFTDHSEFLTKRKRYAKLFKLNPGDYKAWAKGLKKAGYATDKKYPKKLIRIIEKYELYKYDEKVLGISGDNDSEVYIVQSGDGLYSIARKFNMKVSDLMLFNDLSSSAIYPGQRLFLKAKPNQKGNTEKPVVVTTPTTNSDTLISNSNKETQTKTNSVLNTEIPSQETESQETPNYHIVVKGETLYQIAYKYRLAVPDLRRWNGIRKNEIRIGQKVFIKEPNTGKVLDGGSDSHTVIPEDTLYSIAKFYQTSVSELMRLNNLKNYTIYIGQVLKVK